MYTILLLSFVTLTLGCSDFQFKTKNKVLAGRTMDFIIPMQSQVIVFNRDLNMSSTAPDGSTSLQWTSKYGFVGINAFHINSVDEGMNEKGLTCGFLVLDSTVYPPIDPSKNNVSLAIMDFCVWVLGNFQTVSEVEAALSQSQIRVWGDKLPVLNIVLGLHIPIHDALGNNLVIEFLDGKIVTYNNILGILTNDPPLPYQYQNLEQYVYLSPNISQTVTINDYTFKAYSNAGLHLLPGSWSPMDRFVRLATLIRYVNEDNGLLAVTHILDSVYVTNGMEIGYFPAFKRYVYGKTRWSTIKDLTNKAFYFRTDDGAIRAIYLNRVNFNDGTKHTPINIDSAYIFKLDVTSNL